MVKPENAFLLVLRGNHERIKAPVIIIGVAVSFVDSYIKVVSAVYKVQLFNTQGYFSFTKYLDRPEVLEMSVCSVTLDPPGIENSYAEDKIFYG